MSDIRFNNWKHQSGTGGVVQDAAGKVGIGSTLPASALDIGGDTHITGVTTASNFKTGSSNLHSAGVEVAGVNVLGADTPIGTGATIYDDGGARFSGVVTATSFSGSVAASQLTGALPAISGANLTGIDASAIKFGGAVKAQANNSGVVITGVATATKFVGDGSGLTGLPSGSEFNFGSTGITTTKNLGINTTTVDNYETVGAANSFRGIYIGDGSLIFNARLDNPSGYYIGTGRNALNAGPITLGSTMTLDGAWVIV